MVFFIFIQILIEHSANSGDPDQTPHHAASGLGLHCLHMSHKKDARLMWVKDLGLIKLFLNEELGLSLEIKIISFLFSVRLVNFNKQ